MRNTYIATFKGIKGIEHTLYIWDTTLTAGGTPTSLVLEMPGYTINYNAGITDVLQGGIIESSASLYIRNIDNVLDTFLALLNANENRFIIEIHRDSIVHWRGVLLPDFSKVEDSPYGGIQIDATDGIGILSKQDVSILNPSMRSSLLDYIVAGLNFIPTEEFFGVDTYFVRAKTDWFPTDMAAGGEPLSLLSASDSVGVFLWTTVTNRQGFDGSTVTETESMNYKQVIEQILIQLNCILVMSRGVWYIVQRDLLEAADIQYYGFKKDATAVGLLVAEPTYKAIVPASDTYRGDGQFQYMPGLKQAKVTFIANYQSLPTSGVTSFLPPGFELDDTYTTFTLLAGTGNMLHIHINFFELFDCSAITDVFKAYVIYTLEVTIGSYYLEYDAGTYAWTLTPSTIPIYSSYIERRPDGSIQFMASVWHDFYTDDLPVDGEVVFSLTRTNDIISVPTLLSPTPTVIPAGSFTLVTYMSGYLAIYMQYIYNNLNPVQWASFISENTNTEYSLEVVLPDSMFGTAGNASTRLLHVWDGSGWVLALSAASKLWSKGFAETKTLYLNELLVSETVSNQNHSLLMFSGKVYDRTTTELLMANQAIGFSYKGSAYRFFLNNVTYNAKYEDWEGDWIEISRTKIVNTTPETMEIDPLPPTFADVGLPIWGHVKEQGEIVNINSITLQKETVTPIPFPVSGSVAIGVRDDNTISLRTSSQGLAWVPMFSSTIKYGALYNWYAVDNAAGISTGVDGWAVPTDVELQALSTYLGGDVVSGGKLKEMGLAHWLTPNTGATNDVNFNARGAGYREDDGTAYGLLQVQAAYWSSDQVDADAANILLMIYASTHAGLAQTGKEGGFSVRLIRPATVTEQTWADGTYCKSYVGNDYRVYKTVKIGTQVWLAENLAETKYADGTDIPNVTDNALWAADTVGAMCYYDNDYSNDLTQDGLNDFSLLVPRAYTGRLAGARNQQQVNDVLDALPGGGGDVIGPVSAVDSNLAAFDTATGKLIKDSLIPLAEVTKYKDTIDTTSATPTPTGDRQINRYFATALTDNATFAVPTGTPKNGNELIMGITAAGAQTLAWNAIYSGGMPTTITAETLQMVFLYNEQLVKWVYQESSGGGGSSTDADITLTQVYTGNLSGATTQEDANTLTDSYIPPIDLILYTYLKNR